MPLFENFEKLITEHGSAVILRERLSLAADKHSALEKKAADLESVNQRLRLELEKKTKEMDSLRKLVGQTHHKFTQEELKILELLAERGDVALSDLASALKLKQVRLDYHVDRLNQLRLIDVSGDYAILASAHLRQEGREFLFKRGAL